MKNFKRLSAILLALSILISLSSSLTLTASAAEDPNVAANAVMLVEANTGTILYSKNEKAQIAPASTTKIMTVMLALEACDRNEVSLDDVITVGNDVYFDISADGSTLNLNPGEEMVFKDVLYCAMLASANEACNIIAQHVSGSVSAFTDLMNARAIELGCTGTHFANTHGLPNDNHYTTAYDLYLIAANAMSIPLFCDIIATLKYTVPANNKSESRDIENTNKLINEDSPYYYENSLGGKTGYTNAAGYCLVSAAEREDLKLITVVMGAESVKAENGATQTQSFTETKRLDDWGFSNFGYRTIISPLDLVADVPIKMGDGADSVILRPDQTLTALLDNSVNIKDADLDIVIFSERDGEELIAPVEEGDILGQVTVTLAGVTYGKINLVANTGVALNRAEYLKSEIKAFFSNTYVRIVILLLAVLVLLYVYLVINYNRKRRRRQEARKRLAAQRRNELRKATGSTVGKSFEEIEEIHTKS